MRAFGPLVLCPYLLAMSCTGTIGDPAGDAATTDSGGATADVRFACDPATPPIPQRLRRLTKVQLTNSVHDALAALVPAHATQIGRELASAIEAVPDDVLGGDTDYRTMVQTVGQTHVDAYFNLARAFGTALVASSARRTALLGGCADDTSTTNDQACIDEGIARVGRLLFRRPLSSEERALYREIYGASGIDDEALSEVMAALLAAPPFIYLLELGGAPRVAADRIYELTPYELATRLAYHFWQSLPDEALLAAASDGSIMTEAGYRAQVDRLFSDAKARRALAGFYAEWLALDDVPAMDANIGRPDFAAYAGADLPTESLRGHLIDDIQDLVGHYTFDAAAGSLDDILTSTASFARTADVAALYGGVPLWDGRGPPPSHVQAERVGLLSRAALLVNDQATTRPIKRGVFVLKRLLCEDIELPDNMAAIQLELSDGTKTTRARITELSQTPGTTCAGCHVYINPLGFVAESFDALGRVRSSEQVFEPLTGDLLASLPIDTTVQTSLDGGDDQTFESVAELSRALADSGRVHACFARHYVRFTFGRHEDVERDGCLLESLRQAVTGAESLAAMLKGVAMADGFKLLRKPE